MDLIARFASSDIAGAYSSFIVPQHSFTKFSKVVATLLIILPFLGYLFYEAFFKKRFLFE
jgi:hypothetical protein